ncbi:MAG TPA: hypothetical protein VGC10_02185 [Sphingomonas sp.]
MTINPVMMPIKTVDAHRADPDMMPRSLALTLIVGSLVGAGFWTTLTALLIR